MSVSAATKLVFSGAMYLAIAGVLGGIAVSFSYTSSSILAYGTMLLAVGATVKSIRKLAALNTLNNESLDKRGY